MRRALPHFLLAFDFCIKSCGAKRPFIANTIFDRVTAIRAEHTAMPLPLANLGLKVTKPALPIGIEVHRQNRRIMCEVLKHAALLCHMHIQHRLAIVLVARPENMMMRARNNTDRIELHKA